jgi:acetolactate synthase-1/2/3 large subunit
LVHGIDSFNIRNSNEIDTGSRKFYEKVTAPYIEFNIDIHTNVFPNIMFGNPITKMEPNNGN